MQRITGAEELVPVRATLLGPATTLPQEYAGISCLAVDITLPPPESRQEQQLIDLLLAELAVAAEPVVAYRGTDRWRRVFEPLPLASPQGPLPLRAGGTYLITGGLGRVGLELAGLLARKAKGTLVLTGRSPFPARERWPELARGADRTAGIARRLLALEAAGAEVWPAAADVTDAASMRRMLGEVRRRSGRVDGAIHAAGLVDGGSMQLRTAEAAASVLAPKLQGTLLLAELLSEDPPDFLILCSSLNALIGGAGQVENTAANAFLDAFARSRPARLPVVSVNWDAWRDAGTTPERPAAGERGAGTPGMAPEQAVEAFGRILAGNRLPQVAVSMRPLPEVLASARAAAAESRAESAPPAASAPGAYARPDLATDYVAPRGELEERMAALWANLLGVDRVGALDDFFELGGHSLLGTRLMTRVREGFGVELPLRDLFEATTPAELAARVQAALRAGAGQLAPPLTPVAPALRQGPLPLSFAQQRLWFIDQLEPGSPLYNIPVVLRAEGPLDSAALARTLGEIVRRHEALRTSFATLEGSPVQVIQPAAPFVLTVVDLSGLAESAREALALTLGGREARRPFELTRVPLLRGVLLRLAVGDHLAVLTMHHIASDGWSMGVLVRELTALYAAFTAGRPSPLPELPVQYADFTVWQRSWLQGEVLESKISFWRRQLAGLPPRLELPTDRPRPAVQTFHGASWPVGLPAELTRQAQALGRRFGTTLFMVLLTGFEVLLARYSGQEDLAVGSPTAGRTHREIEDLIGFFVNTLVLRGELTGEPSFRELLGRAREAALAAHAHQDLPFERLVEALAPERSLAHAPLFQVMLVLQNAPFESLEIENLRLRPLSGSGSTAKFDLTLSLEERDGSLAGTAEYATDLFDPTTIRRLLVGFERLLAGAVTDPDRSLADLPLLSEAEIHQALCEWNDVPRQAGSACVHRLVEAQARETPAAVALLAADGVELSYHELDRLASRLALRLIELGVRPDDRVGVCLERSWEAVVALLAVLKAGACYLPLDPAYPHERLGFMLADAAVPVLITRDRLAATLPPHGARVVPLGASWGDGWPAEPPGGDLSTAGLDHLSYVIYTSGSTGRPKGVALPHRTLANLVAWQRAASTAPAGRTLQFASLSFDVSLQEILATWAAGGTLVLLAEPDRGDVEALLRRLCAARVERLFLPFVALQQLAEAAFSAAVLPPLREVVTAGEQLQVTPEVRAFFSRLPGCVLRNQYGPSETHVVTEASLWSARPGEVETWPALPPIGRPIAATAVQLLDQRGAPVPIGVSGEIYLGGAGLARGYLGRPELTAERFVPDPWGRGDRLYRTGDLARRRPGGEIEFLGRIDHQVKVRGFRIELGEIEAALATHPAVREAVVVVRGEGVAKRLLACVVPAQVTQGLGEALRAHLRDRLPDYMVPGVFVEIASFPLTPSGKTDRRALALFAAALGETAFALVSPRTPVEELLAGIWADVLDVAAVGVRDNFFSLGGHSLLATRVVSRLRETFGVELPLRVLFERPTIAELAIRVESALSSGAGRLAPPLVPVPRNAPLPLSFAQQRLWFVDQLTPGNPLYNIVAPLRVEGPLDSRVLALCLGEIVRRHEALRTVFAMQEGSPVQVIRPAASFALSAVDLSGLPASARESLAITLVGKEAGRPFDLARGPLLRGLLLPLAEGDQVVSLTLHHIVSDGWSMSILVRELMALYAEYAQGRPSALPELPVQYADFAVWQRSWLQGEVLEGEISFWRRQLADLPPRLELPTDRPRPAALSFRGATRPVRVPVALTRQAQALSRHEGATLFMVLLAAFQALLARYSGQEDLVVGSPVAGRTHREIEGLIGFFVNTLVLRGDLSGEPTFRQLLGRVRETALAALAHQDLPFERLVEELAPERSLAHSPLFQVMLILQNAPFENLEIENLRLRPISGAGTLARFDLTLNLAEQDGGLAGMVEHATELFDPTTIRRLLDGFERLLAGATAAPDRPLVDLPLLSAAERHQLRIEWSSTGAAPGVSVVEMFESWVDRTPHTFALLAPEGALTYVELDRRANRLAHRLRALGVAADSRVGLCAERSTAMIVAVLGILKAGAAYVPLDPAYPRERLAFMVEDARIPVLLTEERLRGSLPEAAAVTVLLDAGDPPDGHDGGRAGRLPGVASPESLAYVIYTSGSTGRPKGVMIHHRGWGNLADAQRRLFGVGPGDRVLQFASLSFDASASEIAMTFSAGATLVLGPRERQLSREELTALLRESTIATLPPTVLATLLPADLPGLKTLIVAGEACPLELARAWALGRRLFNAYGPTEASVCATAKLYGGEERLPIGRPIESVQAHVLDAGGNPLPAGIAGELYLGGPGLARGYLNLPGRTAQSFVPNPFATLPGERLYRTGDRALRFADGEIEFLGRLDHQVKIRGVRIEVGEIEAMLGRHEAVREAVVSVWEDRPGDKLLVAYVVGAEDRQPGTGELRSFLSEHLPEHLVPAAFVVLESLPLTPNGKVDRRALPAPQWSTEVSQTMPRTPVEEVLAGIFAEVLELERVGPEDDFFSLGGHSLLATLLESRLREVFGRELPLRLIFEAPTVAALAEKIAELREGPSAPRILPMPRRGDLPLSFAQQRLWFLDRLAPGNPFYNMFSAVRLIGILDVDALRRTFQKIVWRHEALRTTFSLAGDHPSQVIAPLQGFEVPLVDLKGLATAVPEELWRAELARLSNAESRRPFDLARGPLFRVCLVRLAAREHTLLVNLHHVISDGWSMGILLRELATLYGAFSQGVPSPLPELPIQYADFAIWQRQWLQGERLAAELDYWRQQLAGIPEVLELPYDHPRPAIEAFRGSTRSFALPAVLVRELTALTRRYGATLSMTTLAGFKALLARYSGREDMAVGIAIANRTRREIEGLIGFFINTLVVRVNLAGSPGFGELVERVRETALGAYAHQELPFERLVEELHPERDLSRNPLIQVMLGYQNFPRGAAAVPGLRLVPSSDGQMTAGTAKFDFSLFVIEDGDRMVGALEYNRDLFDATTIQRLLGHFENLLAAAVAQPRLALGLLPMLDEGERHQLEMEWSDTGSAYPAAASLQELFAGQAHRTPDAPALRFASSDGEHALTYAELDRRAGRLARRLRHLGVGLESRVGLCLERSLEMVVGVLGILKAGGAYVPLDPSYPRERLELLMRDSGAAALVTAERWRPVLPVPPLGGAALLCLDRDPGWEKPAVELPGDGQVPSSALAYVMYTSGSTGEPKGVAVTHRGVVRLVRETSYARFGPDEVMVQIAPYTFDASTPEIWGALLNGACLVIPPPGLLSLAELGQLLTRHGVTTLHLTVGLFNQTVDENLPALTGLRQLLTGGDVMSVAHARRASAKLPGVRLANMYGPTENTTFTCCYPISGPDFPGASVPLGWAIANSSVHLLSADGRPVPVGVAGELHAGGEGLARGYLGRPELTAERFVPHPASGARDVPPGSRLYRTGDLARRLADGRIEFLGRIDQQVKIRGFRIEPGEVESRLGEHPAVLQNVVVAREDVPGDRRLVAYVVQNPAYEEEGVQTAQVAQWSELFDGFYRQEAAGSDPTFNIVGWNSTYTGLPLSTDEMEEWLDDTVERIAGLAPQRVLEIGCGTGMILFRVAPRSRLYVGTDISRQALDSIERQLGRLGWEHSRVELLQQPADRFAGLAADSFDTVILNSVAQYFPSGDYLAQVLARAVEVVRPGGAIFLGDLRSLPLLAAFHTSLELFQADPEMPLPRLRQKVQNRRLQENELVVDPAFFGALKRRLPKIGRVEVHPKRGRFHNELTGFRYQVVLRLGAGSTEPEPVSWLDWQEEGLTLAALRRRLEEDRPEVLGLCNVPNARVAEAVAASRLLREADGPDGMGMGTAGDLRRSAAAAAAGAVEPQALWEIPLDLPYEIELGWASPGAAGGLAAVLRRRGAGEGRAALAALLPEPQELPELPEDVAAGASGRYSNHPLQGRFARRIAPALREFLKQRLPDYMVPSTFVLLEAMPLSHNEKVDRRRLPAPEIVRPEVGKALVLPRNATEQRLVEIWRELLEVEQIGIEDDFFALGGHSLLATQAVSRLREAFGVELPLRTFFTAGTIAAVAEEVAHLRLLRGEAEVPPIVPAPREGLLPLSFAQERLWFLDRLSIRPLAYNESAAFRLEGHLDVGALRWSLDEILRRHESLRTTFPEVNGQPVQRILAPVPFEIPLIDLQALPLAWRETAARNLALGQARRRFDLARGPLVRGLLVHLGERAQAVLFTSHHIVSDGWSTGVFVRELSVLYSSRLAGGTSPLPPLSIQYADFAFWQRQWLRGKVLDQQLAYWRGRLTGIAALGLATDRPRPVRAQTPSGQRLVVVPAGLTQKLRALSRSHGATLFMTLLAGFQALLHRYTGQDDVAVGSAIANRNRGEVEGLIGFFINMLVLRTDLSGEPSFGQLLERVRDVALGAYTHQDLPFEKLVEELRPDRDLRRSPLFQVSFQLLNVPSSPLDLPGLTLAPLAPAARSAKFDLDLALIEGEERLGGPLDFDADLFDGTTMERLLAHFDRLLTGAVASPGSRLSELPLLTRAEHGQVMAEWNDTRAALPAAGLRLHEQFELQVRRTPEAVALVCEGEELRYGELDARANQLAHLLRRWNVGPGVRVGLCVERSLELVVGLLGTLKAGGAYVPLDPSYPRERLSFMLADAQVPVLLTQERLLAAIQPDPAIPAIPADAPRPRVLCLDAEWQEVAAESATSPAVPGSVDELAYVIYTSGSTGRPKGAMNSHRAICNRLLWLQGVDGLTGDDRVLQKTPVSFDVSVWELFWPLVTGARLVLARPGGHQDPDYLVRLLGEAGITTAHFVPSMLQVFLEAPGVESLTLLRRVICSGEALSTQLASRFAARFPAGAAPVLYNLYGPTEAAVEVTAWRCAPDSPAAAVPIGRPVANTRALVLDPHLRPVPIGIPGELYLGGVQLARGYLDRPDLTAEKFIPDPFAAPEDRGARLYRTGDQVRRLAGGEIVYLGRLDHQVKIRGFRIELGEVEAALTSLPGVREAVVVAREDASGDRRLVAYLTGIAGIAGITGEGEVELAVEALRQKLRDRLPEFMVPTAFVPLSALPLNPSGKVDRQALPAPDRSAVAGFVAPRTPAEEVLAQIWEEVLRLERVGVHDNFFERGGHSLLAVLLMTRIEKRFGRSLPLATLFSAPTVEAMAALLQQSASPAGRSPLVVLQPQGDRTPFFCIHPVGGNVLCYLDLARHLAPDQPLYALQTPAAGDNGGPPASVEAMAARYLRELRRVQPHGPYRLGGWSMGGAVAFEMARQLAGAGEELDLVALIDTLPPAVEPGRAPATEDEMMAWFAQDLARLLGYEVGIAPEELRSLPGREKLAHVTAIGHAMGLLPEGLGLAQMEPLFETFAVNLQASRSYVSGPYAGKVSLYFSAQTFAASGPELLDGWSRLAEGGIETRTLPGDHYSLLRRPQVEILAGDLLAHLDRR
ncbi:MAG TPA: amino acid adenylation domain-containing protein [Thermoanaerobaculia bacterium]|nr:amino acid adenylation domain-containing protein [Thermoanaerobaculia bacterium]